MGSDSEKNFWRLLADYEALTRQETVAIRHENFRPWSRRNGSKRRFFPAGCTRRGPGHEPRDERGTERTSRRPDHRGNENLLALAAIKESARKRLAELAQARVRLQHVRRNYHEKEIPGAVPMGFAAHG